ncbi:MAG: hypothetical protein JXR94_20690, partial [Candidatus Hydrogenedentes bacterium]|nr:hypothetical protein [Candidatus Hydrogenedentota bacterium]
RWRIVFPPEVFVGQFQKMADGFQQTLEALRQAAAGVKVKGPYAKAFAAEQDVAEVCAIHFRSVANQARFILARDALAAAKDADAAKGPLDTLEALLEDEIRLAVRLHTIQGRDSRFGFEASNHYFYIPVDLAEKVVNCRDLQTRWLPAERAKWGL